MKEDFKLDLIELVKFYGSRRYQLGALRYEPHMQELINSCKDDELRFLEMIERLIDSVDIQEKQGET